MGMPVRETVTTPRMSSDELIAAWPRLVRLCARLAGDAAVAEDLAQETLIEAWHHEDTLRDPAASSAWLAGIARNVCRRWLRQRARERVHTAQPPHGQQGEEENKAPESARPEQVVDDFDLEAELEREELADLLDRALAQLPVSTRDVLVERYLRERAQAEVAARLGLSENVVAVRLHRGRLLLRQVLATRFQSEAMSYGLITAETAGWQETRLWCPECGQRHLVGRMPAPPANDRFQLRCPVCHAEPGVYMSNGAREDLRSLQGETRGFKRTLARMMMWADEFYRPALGGQPAACSRCGAPVALRLGMPLDGPPSLREVPGVHARCGRCGWEAAQGLSGLLLALPEGQRFWRAEGRIRVLPRREIDTGARPAYMTTFASVSGKARLDVVSAAATHEVLGIHPGAGS